MIFVIGNVVGSRRPRRTSFRTSDPLPPAPTTADPEVAYAEEALEGELLELVAPLEVSPALLYLTQGTAVSPGVLQAMSPPEVVVLMSDGSVLRRPLHGRAPWQRDYPLPGTRAAESSLVNGGSGEALESGELGEESEEPWRSSDDPEEEPAPTPPLLGAVDPEPFLLTTGPIPPGAPAGVRTPFVGGASEGQLRLTRPVFGFELDFTGDALAIERELGEFRHQIGFRKTARRIRLLVSADTYVKTSWIDVPEWVRNADGANDREEP